MVLKSFYDNIGIQYEKRRYVKLTESTISLKVDFIFKDIFSNNKKLLIDLLESILGYEIKSIEIIQDFALDKSKKVIKKVFKI